MFLKSKENKLFEVLEAGHWHGLSPVEVTEIESPVNRWTGPRRTLAQWHEVLAFFEWSYATHKSEAMVHWFLGESGQWLAAPLPQRGVGMTVKLLDDHPQYAPTFERVVQAIGPAEIMGTDHHHCSSSAFQSRTDHSDETGKEGLHITVGGVGSGKPYSLHARSSFRRQIMPTCLGDWFEAPQMPPGLSPALQNAILLEVLSHQAPEGTTFPEWWKEQIIPYVTTATVWSHSNGTSNHGYQGYQGHWTHGQGHNANGGHRSSGRGNISGWLEDDILRLCSEFNMPLTGFAAWLTKLTKNVHLVALVKGLATSRSDLSDAIEATYGLIHDEHAAEGEQQQTLGWLND